MNVVNLSNTDAEHLLAQAMITIDSLVRSILQDSGAPVSDSSFSPRSMIESVMFEAGLDDPDIDALNNWWDVAQQDCAPHNGYLEVSEAA